MEEVQPLDVDKLNTRKITESLDDTIILVINNKGTTALPVSAVPELALTGAQFTGVGDLDDIGVGAEGLQESDSLLGLLEGLNIGRDDERDFSDFLDSVSTGKNERRKGRGSESGDDSESALVLIDLNVPPAPSFGRSKHTTTTTHVTEGSL